MSRIFIKGLTSTLILTPPPNNGFVGKPEQRRSGELELSSDRLSGSSVMYDFTNNIPQTRQCEPPGERKQRDSQSECVFINAMILLHTLGIVHRQASFH